MPVESPNQMQPEERDQSTSVLHSIVRKEYNDMARHGRISGRTFVGAAALAVIATGALAGTASAHVPEMSRTCTELTLNLHYYPDGTDSNWVTVTIGGKKVVDHLGFSGIYNPAPFPASAQDTVVVTIWTKDDPNGTHKPEKWDGDFTVAPPEVARLRPPPRPPPRPRHPPRRRRPATPPPRRPR